IILQMASRQQRAGFHTVNVSDARRRETYSFTIPTRYKNLKFINAGSEGAVVSADDEDSNKKVAIKKRTNTVVGSWSATHAIREFILLSSLNHPNIIRILNIFTPQEDVQNFKDIYLVMELMDHNISQVISKMRLDHASLKFFIYQILCAVNHLHRQGIIHRDLKPCNIAVNKRCGVKVLDFGSSRMFTPIEQMSAYKTTTHYRAPEVLLELTTLETRELREVHRSHFSEKVDIWSIGCIFYELITGKIMFEGTETISQWRKVVETMGSPPESFIAQLDANLAKQIRSQPQRTGKPLNKLILDIHFYCDPATCKKRAHTNMAADAGAARKLISKLLEIDPKARYSAAEALHHPYFSCYFNNDEVNAPLSKCVYDSAVDQGTLPLGELKSLIFQEVKRLESAQESARI
ncbi:hypothetical protein PENTCL1PPCAC_12866, partial [Pristionchus entomophagus]